MTPQTALARTTRLLNEQYFGGNADPDAIAAGLLRTTIRLIADEKNASTVAGQADGLPNLSYFDFEAGFWVERHRPNFLFVHYQDLLADREGKCGGLPASST